MREPRVSLRNRMPAGKLRKGVYLIPSLFTAGNLMCGFFSIISTFNGDYVTAALFIILANVLDGLDGYAARLTRTTSQFGVEFDSLADVVSFGVAPGNSGLFLGAGSLGNLGLVGGLYLCCLRRAPAVALQRPGTGSRQRSFCRVADPCGCADDHRHHRPVLLLGRRRGAQQACDVAVGDLWIGGFDGERFSVFQSKKCRSEKAHPFWMLVSGFILITLIIAERQIMFFMIFLLYTLSGPLLWCLTTYKRRRERRREMAEAMP